MSKRLPNPILPDVAQWWHCTRNETSPDDYTAGSSKKVWWTCHRGHEFHAAIRDVTAGHGCPVCSGNKVLAGYNDLATVHPNLAVQWHPSLNSNLTPHEVSPGSKRKVWWLGGCGHSFEATINSRTSGTGCPYCSGQKILSGFNDLASTHPRVASQWHPTLNADLLPQDVSAGTNKKAWWLGDCSHEFECSISEKVRSGKGCPYCAGKKILAGFNDLKSTDPNIAAELSNENPMSAEEISAKSVKKVLWDCPQGHTYLMAVRARVLNGSGCVYCSGQQRLTGFNDFASLHPEVAAEWDSERNGSLTPHQIASGSSQKVWWKCPKGHSYQTTVHARTNDRKRVDCTVCSNRVLVTGVNDLATLHPEIAAQWHPTRNGNLAPSDVLRSHTVKVWWQCAKGHEWNVSPATRFSRGTAATATGCPTCQAKSFSSVAEKEIAEILSTLGEEVITNSRSILQGTELDIYLPQRQFAIEYNGLYWHSMDKNGMYREYHRDKWRACKDRGIQLVQIWEDDWSLRRETVLRGLLYKLGLLEKASTLMPELGLPAVKRIYARATRVSEVALDEVRDFLEDNHVQGFASGSYYLGLRDAANELVSCIVLKKEQGRTLNIIRYATDRTVVGGFTKLVSYAERNLDVARFVTFSDHCVSDGGLYESNGFFLDKELPPSYSYMVNGKREHKFGYRLKRFKNDPNLKWKAGLSERELAQLNGMPRIYDAGKTRWVRTVQK